MWKTVEMEQLVQQFPVLFFFLFTVGLLTIGNYLLSILRLAYQNHLMSGINLKKFNKDGNEYALITGSTDGIGKEFALQLAKLGFNLLLVSRTASKLKAVAQEINEKYPEVTVKTLAVDFSRCTEDDYARLEQLIAHHTVSILVNNVAVSHAMPTSFAEESLETIQSIVDVNITATLRLTKLCLPPMVSNHHGLIVNLGSFAGLVPTGLLQTYSGSKAFLSAWSEALAAELAGLGIYVTHLNTYFVVSNMSKISRPTLMIPTAKDYVRAALKRVGAAPCIAPYPWHNIVQWAMENLVSRSMLIDKVFAMQQSIRKRALRKLERQSKGQ